MDNHTEGINNYHQVLNDFYKDQDHLVIEVKTKHEPIVLIDTSYVDASRLLRWYDDTVSNKPLFPVKLSSNPLSNCKKVIVLERNEITGFIFCGTIVHEYE